jgi:hypothetical protein
MPLPDEPFEPLSEADQIRAYNQGLYLAALNLRGQAKRAPEIQAALERQEKEIAKGVEPKSGKPMAILSKVLIGICVILAAMVLYLCRDEVTSSGPRGMLTRIHNRWTGTVILCYPGGTKCVQVYPPSAEPDKQD